MTANPIVRASSLAFVILMVPCVVAAQAVVTVDSAQAGRFDGGKMWTFEYPPGQYFSETYDFDADAAWFERARMAALRIPGCSASFVSPMGLLATNHHCVRGRVSQVSREGENLLDNGFYAATMEDERPIPGYRADQLLAALDVTDELDQAEDRDAASDELRDRLRSEYGSEGDSIVVQLVPLYNGGRTSAYVFRRFTDVRLVMAAELQMGFFGGDPDNFTYPRYALDFAFLRVYGPDGEPYRPSHYFGWSRDGVEEGDVVFVIGNPGSTNRLTTMAQLEFQRDIQLPRILHFLQSRLDAMGAYREALPEEAEAFDIRNRMFGFSNSLKATIGRLAALNQEVIMARRADGERQLRERIAADAELAREYDGLFDRLSQIQSEKAELAQAMGAFIGMGNSATIRRALAAHEYLEAREAGVPPDSLEALAGRILRGGDLPEYLERSYLALRLGDIARSYGAGHPLAAAALPDGTPEASAAAMWGASALATGDRAREALEQGTLGVDDPAVRFIAAVMPAYTEYRSELGRLGQEENQLGAAYGRAKFAVYGRSVPPDGSSSPRITDGVVRGYSYNGTLAPAYTTFYGLYDRHFAHRGNPEWALPDRWQAPPDGLDLATPLNFASTADTYGGNSGSPAVTKELELVGLNFDRNIQGLSRDYIYLPQSGRNVMVDVRAVWAAMENVYGAHRIMAEIAGD